MAVMVWLHVGELLQQCVACQVRLMIWGHFVPLFVIGRRPVMVTLVPQQASIAAGGVNAQAEPHCTVMLLAQVITGGVVSWSLSRWLQNAEVEQQSVIREERG